MLNRYITTAFLLVLPTCWALADKQKSVPGVVKANLQYVQTDTSPRNEHLRRRFLSDGGMFEEPLENLLTFYTMNITIGSPDQSVTVLVDTGSSDLWIPGDGFSKGFEKEKSSTWKLLSSDFAIRYVKGYARGLWGTDKVQFKSSGAVLDNQRFAVATQSSETDMGVFGIGPVNSEVSKPFYDNIPIAMVKQGLIAKNAYSIYLDDQDAKTGSILFGGIDEAKFIPPLTTMSLTSTSALEVTLNEIDIGEQKFYLNTPIVLDTGTSLMYLPQQYVNAIAMAFGAKYDISSSLYRVSRASLENANTANNVTFSIMGAKIQVPLKELFWPLHWFTGDDEDTDDYVLTVMPNTEALGFSILGDTFLRSAYAIYDLDYRQISLAQASFSKESKLTPIVSSVPGSLLSEQGLNINDSRSRVEEKEEVDPSSDSY